MGSVGMIIELGVLVRLLNVDNNSFIPVSKEKISSSEG